MKLLADECCDAALVAALRSDGHDVLYVVEVQRGATDDQILERANSEERILVTEDKDFGELIYRLKRPVLGIILLRFDVINRALKASRLQSLLSTRSNQLHGAFVVIDKEKIRLRPL
jgi:predicted nuclease of predicted toxin-antitoxin system